MSWIVLVSGRAAKHIRKLPRRVQDTLETLIRELRAFGPVRTRWPNYGKLVGRKDCHHCHIRKGRPTYY